MMRPSKCWIGLLPLLAIWGLANWLKTSAIEADLTRRAGAAVAKIGLEPRAVSAAGRDVSLSGQIFETAQRDGAVAAADAEAGVRLVRADDLKGLPVASPYSWGATRDGGKVTLTGSVPNPAARGRIVAAAKAAMPGADVIDQMTYAGGAPASFENAATYGLGALGGLTSGATTLANAAWSLNGQAASLPSYRAAIESAKALPACQEASQVISGVWSGISTPS